MKIVVTPDDSSEGEGDDSSQLQHRKRRGLDNFYVPHVWQNAPEGLLSLGMTPEARSLDPTPTSACALRNPPQETDDHDDVRLLLEITDNDFNGLEETFKAVERVVY